MVGAVGQLVCRAAEVLEAVDVVDYVQALVGAAGRLVHDRRIGIDHAGALLEHAVG